MTTMHTISGIPEDTWEDAKNEYDNVSKRIKQLLQKDLRTQQEQKDQKIDLLKNSDLSSDQIKVAREMIKCGSLEKTSAQVAKIINDHYTDDDYKNKCKKALRESDAVPFEKSGSGLDAIETKCLSCGASNPLKVLRKKEFKCAGCDKRLYDLDS